MTRYYKYFGCFVMFTWMYGVFYFLDKGRFDYFVPAFVVTVIILLQYHSDKKDKKI